MTESDSAPEVRRNRDRSSAGDKGTTPKKVRSLRSKILISVLVIAVLAVAVVGGGAIWGLWSLSKIDRVDVALSDVKEPTEPFNILVVGSDSRAKISKDDPSASGMLGKDAPSGQRSDSLMVARVDLQNQRVDLLSIPRDLWVPIAGQNKEQRINTAYFVSAQTTVDTIEKELGIPINHFAEVDFSGFRSLIDALGGVPMYFSHPVKDLNSGLNIKTKGCTILDGEQGLAFARARHLKWNDGTRWVSDPTGDLGRMTRQQLLTRASLAKAQTLGLKDVTKLKGLVDATIGSVKLDAKWGAGDLISIGRQLSGIDPQRMQTHALPVIPHRTSGGAAVVLLDDAAAQPVLDIFRGTAPATPVTTTTLPPPDPSDVSVTVINTSAGDGEGRRVSYVLDADGFTISGVAGGTGELERTTITHAPGQSALAELVAGWVTPAPKIQTDKTLSAGQVVLDLGADFDRIVKPDASSAGATTSTVPHSSSDDGSGSGDAHASTTTVPVTTTTQPGWTPGVPPEGTVCR
ncbi:MAG: LCP family protein [Microthrixaceae bacterium]|nr:LCP family protein [Microthrixaceae bacterium]